MNFNEQNLSSLFLNQRNEKNHPKIKMSPLDNFSLTVNESNSLILNVQNILLKLYYLEKEKEETLEKLKELYLDLENIKNHFKEQQKQVSPKPISVTEKEFSVLEIIGTGKKLFTDISSKLGLSHTGTKDILDSARLKGLIKIEKVMNGGKGRPTNNYFLTPLGIATYKRKYGENLKTAKLEQSTHKNPTYGLITEIGKFYESNDCEVLYNDIDTTYKLYNEKEIKFDLTVIPSSIETKPLYIITIPEEFNEQYFYEKFSQCLEFTKIAHTNEIYLIAQDQKTIAYLQQQLFKWVRTQENIQMLRTKDFQGNATIIFKTATLDDLKADKFKDFCYIDNNLLFTRYTY